MKKLILAVLFLGLVGCTSPEKTVRALNATGFKDIQVTGWAGPFTCGQDDVTATSFIATNPSGVQVTGVVCCKGFMFGGCTIRF